MGPCLYCKEMIYLDWIAERGYHRDCHEKALAAVKAREEAAKLQAARFAQAYKKDEKRRIRRAQIRAGEEDGMSETLGMKAAKRLVAEGKIRDTHHLAFNKMQLTEVARIIDETTHATELREMVERALNHVTSKYEDERARQEWDGEFATALKNLLKKVEI